MPLTDNQQSEEEVPLSSKRKKIEVARLEKRIKGGRAIVAEFYTQVNRHSGRMLINKGLGGVLPLLGKERFSLDSSVSINVKRCRVTVEIIED